MSRTKRQMCSWVQEKCMMSTRTTLWVTRGHGTSYVGRTTILDPWVVFSHAVSMHPFNAWNISCAVCTVLSTATQGTSATRVSGWTATRASGAAVQSGRLVVGKVKGTANIADAMTKYHTAAQVFQV